MDHTASDTSSPYPVKDFRFRVVILCLCICCFIASLDTIILSSTLPAIAASLQATTTDAYWCSASFLFAQSVVQLIYAVVARALNRRTCMLAALGFFGFASILCATARNIQWLVAARTIQGVGTGGTNALVQLILTDIAPLAERPKYTGLVTLFSALGLVIGGLCGAAIVQHTTWPLVFWINLPICVPTMVGFAWCLDAPPRQSSVWTAIKKTDWGGGIIVTGSLAGILFALNSGNAVYPWTSGRILSPLICGGVGLLGFVAYERFVAKENAILPGRLFSNVTAVSAYILALLHSIILWTATYYFFLYLTFCSHSYLGAAILMLPATLTFPPSAAIAGHIIGRTLKYQIANIIGFSFLVGGLSGLANLDEFSSVGLQIGLLLIVGTGFGIPFISKVFMAQTAVAEDDQYMATAIVSTVTSVGECFGVAISSTTFQNRWNALLEKKLKQTVLSVVIKGSDAERSTALLATLDKETATFYRHIAMQSFQTVWIVMGSLAGVALILSLFIRDPKTKEATATETSVEAIILDNEKS
ncbi:major facilitator superfamily domain-containing protein [Trichoderma sp. SZMC 28011]